MGSAEAVDTERGRPQPRPDAARPAVRLVGPPLPPGSVLDGDRYRIDGVRGRGEQGITYTGTDRRRGRDVVVIELFPVGSTRTAAGVAGPADLGVTRDRVVADARALARLGHPNVVPVRAVLEEGGTAYVVVDAVAGAPLAEVVATRGAFAEAEALDVVQQAADAIAAARLVGIPVRGIATGDLVLAAHGRVVLVDPGLAAGPGEATSTADDVRALATLLHLLLAGAAPPVDGPPVALWRVNPTVSRATSDVVEAALGPDPADRPGSPAVLLGRLGVGVEVLGRPDMVDLRADPLAPFAPARVAPPAPLSAAAARVLADDVPAWRPPLLPAAATVALVVPVVGPSGRAFAVPVPVGPTTTPRLPTLGVRPARSGLTPAERLELARTVPPGRRWVTVPFGLAAMALASAQPAALVVLLGLAVAPVVATVGDRALRPDRARAWLPVWWARNLVISTVRSTGAALVVFLGTCVWFGAGAYATLAPAGPWALRTTGAVAGGLLGLSIGRGGDGFRSHLGLDAVTRRLVPRGRLSVAGVAVLVACVGLAAVGLAVEPEVWPVH